jgi:hypothetical protein
MVACDIALVLSCRDCPSSIGLPFVVKCADRMAATVPAQEKRSLVEICGKPRLYVPTRLSNHTGPFIRRFLFLIVRDVDSRSDKHHAI